MHIKAYTHVCLLLVETITCVTKSVMADCVLMAILTKASLLKGKHNKLQMLGKIKVVYLNLDKQFAKSIWALNSSIEVKVLHQLFRTWCREL